MANTVSTTGSCQLYSDGSANGIFYWKLTLTETAVDYANGTSTISYDLSGYRSTSGASGYAKGSAYYFYMYMTTPSGTNTITDSTYKNGSRQTSCNNAGFTCSDGSTFFALKMNSGSGATYGTLYMQKDYASVDSYALSGSYTVAHNSSGAGAVSLHVQFGKWTYSGHNTKGVMQYFDSSDLTMTSTAGIVKIHNGSSWVNAIPYVHNGSTWKKAIPYIHNGSTWKMAKGS